MTKRGLFGSIRTKLLLMILLPVILLSVILTLMAANNIQKGMQEEALHGLRGAAVALQHIYNEVDSGEWIQDGSGNVKKGSLDITGNYKIVDELKEDALVGTKAGEQVIKTVLENGEEYSDTAVVINDEAFYAYYIPIKQGNEVVGMVFAGTPSADVNEFIQSKASVIALI